MLRLQRVAVGIVVDVALFGLAIPVGSVLLGRRIDVWLGGSLWTSVAVPVFGGILCGWGLLWLTTAWVALVRHGAGHVTELFGVEISPPPARLVAEGVYAAVRHPMCYGYLWFLVGLGLLFRSAGAGLVVPAILALCAVAYLKAFEEPRLRRRFGDAYRDYERRVPMLLPSMALFRRGGGPGRRSTEDSKA